MSADHPTTAKPEAARVQFSLATLLWLMATLGMALAYLRSFGQEASLMGLAVVGIGLAVGTAIGLAAKRPADGIYWSLLGAFFAYLCTLGVIIPHWSLPYAWTVVGAAAGAASGVLEPGRPIKRMLVGALTGGIVFALYGACFFTLSGEILVDALVAPIAGALLGAVIEAIAWTERRSRRRRNLCAAGLMLAVMAGNMLARRIVAGW